MPTDSSVRKQGKDWVLEHFMFEYGTDTVLDLPGVLLFVKGADCSRLCLVSATDKESNKSFLGLHNNMWLLAKNITGSDYKLDVTMALQLRLPVSEYPHVINKPLTLEVLRMFRKPEGGFELAFRLRDPWDMHQCGSLQVTPGGADWVQLVPTSGHCRSQATSSTTTPHAPTPLSERSCSNRSSPTASPRATETQPTTCSCQLRGSDIKAELADSMAQLAAVMKRLEALMQTMP